MTETTPSRVTSDTLLKRLKDAGINVSTREHKALLTVEDAKSVRLPSDSGGHCKNLFLRNKKGRMWLVTCHEDQTIDLKSLGAHLTTTAQGTAAGTTSTRLSFASAERLMKYLGVIPGAVSPFGLINDTNVEVTFYLDKSLLEYTTLYFHPLDNRLTTQINTNDLIRFMESIDHPVTVVDFDSTA